MVTIAAAGSARAHGDPASHYLETDLLYPSFASQASIPAQLRLLGLLQTTERRGYPIKVALVAGPEDLVDDLTMLRRPQAYAQFVARSIEGELAAPIVVVTPAGLGVAGVASVDGRLRPLGADAARGLLRGVDGPRAADGDALARVAMTAVRRVARAGGHPLPARVAPAEQYVPPPAPAQSPAEGPVTAAPGGGSGLLAAVPALLAALALGGVYLRSRDRRRLTMRNAITAERAATLSNERPKL
jgi:hypothetical protein